MRALNRAACNFFTGFDTVVDTTLVRYATDALVIARAGIGGGHGQPDNERDCENSKDCGYGFAHFGHLLSVID